MTEEKPPTVVVPGDSEEDDTPSTATLEAVAAAAAATATDEKSGTASSAEEIKVMKDMFDTKVDGGKKSAWAMTLETFGMADGGKAKKTDIIVDTTREDALDKLKKMVEDNKAVVGGDGGKWSFSVTPLKELNATIDDILMAFVMWSCKEEDEVGTEDEKKKKPFNISKAFRRLESYVTWMEDNKGDLLEPPMTVESVTEAHHCWKIRMTHDKAGHAVWWIDIGELDIAKIKAGRKQQKGNSKPSTDAATESAETNEESKAANVSTKGLPLRDSLRYMVWISHVMMLDPKAQEHGMVIVEAMGFKGLIDSITMIPMDLGTKLDRLTIGVLPIKMKKIYMFNNARWVPIMMTLMSPFLSKKMRQRVEALPKKANAQEIFEEALGKDCIPLGFPALEGVKEKDEIEEKFGMIIP